VSSAPTGNGEQRGPESGSTIGTNLPGTRPSRAAANNARNKDFLGSGDPKEQGGFGTEDMQHSAPHMSMESVRPSDVIAKPVDLMEMGDAGQTFGGN
jgi:hypothetical protein